MQISNSTTSTLTATPSSTVNATLTSTVNASANVTVPHHHTEAAALPQNTIIGIAVGVSAGLVAFVWAVARYIYNKRYLDTVHAKTLNLRVVNP